MSVPLRHFKAETGPVKHIKIYTIYNFAQETRLVRSVNASRGQKRRKAGEQTKKERGKGDGGKMCYDFCESGNNLCISPKKTRRRKKR